MYLLTEWKGRRGKYFARGLYIPTESQIFSCLARPISVNTNFMLLWIRFDQCSRAEHFFPALPLDAYGHHTRLFYIAFQQNCARGRTSHMVKQIFPPMRKTQKFPTDDVSLPIYGWRKLALRHEAMNSWGCQFPKTTNSALAQTVKRSSPRQDPCGTKYRILKLSDTRSPNEIHWEWPVPFKPIFDDDLWAECCDKRYRKLHCDKQHKDDNLQLVDIKQDIVHCFQKSCFSTVISSISG